MRASSADEKILSYSDVVLRKSDLDILSGPFFLNDRIIAFYFSYLSSCYSSEEILLAPPSISFWIMNCPDNETLSDFLQPLDLPGMKLVLFPVNNNEDLTKPEGGSHWSLLVFERDANIFVHHDSYGGSNKSHAKRLYKAVAHFMGRTKSASSDCYVDYLDSPQQVNSHDCGLYVTAIARAICCWYQTAKSKGTGTLWFSDVKERVTPSAVAEMRNDILRLIRDLMLKQ